MVRDLFDAILQELGNKLDLQDLHLDSAGTCRLNFKDGLSLYIEPYEKAEALLLVTDIGEVPGGRYREDVLREALKENTISGHASGAFGFGEQSHHLKLFRLFRLKDLSADKIIAVLFPLMEKASKWKSSLTNGEVPQAGAEKSLSSSGPAGLFGLRP